MIIAIPLWLLVVEVYKAGVFAPALGVLREIWYELDGILKKPGKSVLTEETEVLTAVPEASGEAAEQEEKDKDKDKDADTETEAAAPETEELK